MAGIRQAYQLIAFKVRLFDPLNPVVILEQNLELQPGVVLFQAVLQVPFALPCAASMNPSGQHQRGVVLLYKSVLYRMCNGLGLPSASLLSQQHAGEEHLRLYRPRPSLQCELARKRGSEKARRQCQQACYMDVRQRTRLALDALVLKHHSNKLADFMVLQVPLALCLHMTCAVQRRAASYHFNAVSQSCQCSYGAAHQCYPTPQSYCGGDVLPLLQSHPRSAPYAASQAVQER